MKRRPILPRTLRRAVFRAWFVAVLCFCSVAHAAGGVKLTARFGVHDDFDRVVIGLSPGIAFSSSQSGSTLTLQLNGAGQVAQPSQTGRRVIGMEGGDGVFSIRMAPDMHAHVFRVGDRLVIDVSAGAAPASSPGKQASSIGPAEDVAGPRMFAGSRRANSAFRRRHASLQSHRRSL